jgi:hypothetical protein
MRRTTSGTLLAQGQAPPAAMPPRPLPASAFVLDTAEQGPIRVTPIEPPK